MAYTHVLTRAATLPTGQITDSGSTSTGDFIVSAAPSTVVPAYGDGPNAVTATFPASGFQSMILLATVPCVVTFTGVSVIDGVSTSDVTLVAGVIRQVLAITGACTAISIGANTTPAGLAGTIQISVLYNA